MGAVFLVTEIPLGSYKINITNFFSVERLDFSVISFEHSGHNIIIVDQFSYSVIYVEHFSHVIFVERFGYNVTRDQGSFVMWPGRRRCRATVL